MGICYQKDGLTILPFIQAPVGTVYQETLILCENNIKEKESDFKESIRRHYKNEIIDSVYIRLFEYKPHFVISISFPSETLERGTNRKGQVLTIGALFEKNLFNNRMYCSSFCIQLIETINYIFELDLYQNGVDKFLRFLNDESKFELFEKKLTTLKVLTSNSHHLLNPSSSFISKFDLNKLSVLTDKVSPKISSNTILLCKKNLSSKGTIEVALAFFDEILNSNPNSKIDYANKKYENELEFHIIPCLPDNLDLNNKIRIITTVSNNGILLIE
jgi:hypothetical protein